MIFLGRGAVVLISDKVLENGDSGSISRDSLNRKRHGTIKTKSRE